MAEQDSDEAGDIGMPVPIYAPGAYVELFSGECGYIVETFSGSHYPEPKYIIRYVDATGRGVEAEFRQNAIEGLAEEIDDDPDEGEEVPSSGNLLRLVSGQR